MGTPATGGARASRPPSSISASPSQRVRRAPGAAWVAPRPLSVCASGKACAARAGRWLVGDAMTLADITVACYATYAGQSLPVELSQWPALAAHVARCEALDVFAAHYAPFFVPQPKGIKESDA